MRNNIIEGLQLLDSQHAVMLNYLNEYGAQDQRTRTAMNVYNGARMMLEAVSGCRVCTDTDGRHHAIKTNPHGDALRDSLQPFDRDRADNAPVIFATKRDKTYNRRKYLAVDTDAQTFTAELPRMFYTRDEVIEVGSRDLAKLADTLTGNGFTKR